MSSFLMSGLAAPATRALAGADGGSGASGAESGGAKAVFTIGDLAREFDVTHRALRFYEDKGLLSPKRRGNTRLYSRRDRARLKLVLHGKRIGFSLAEIRELLDLYDLRDGQETQLRVALEKFSEQRAILERQRQDLDEAIADLDRTRDIVQGMLAQQQQRNAASR